MSKKKQGSPKQSLPIKAKKTTAKRSTKASSDGSASQTILNVTATLAGLNGSNVVPKDKMFAYVKCEGVMAKSTIANALTKLKREGLLVVTAKEVTITEKGLKRADTSGDLTFATNADYQKKIQENLKIKPRSCDLMAELADGRVRNKKEVAAAIGCKMNSTWANMLTPLKKLKILDFDRDTINLTDDMFPFGRPGIE